MALKFCLNILSYTNRWGSSLCFAKTNICVHVKYSLIHISYHMLCANTWLKVKVYGKRKIIRKLLIIYNNESYGKGYNGGASPWVQTYIFLTKWAMILEWRCHVFVLSSLSCLCVLLFRCRLWLFLCSCLSGYKQRTGSHFPISSKYVYLKFFIFYIGMQPNFWGFYCVMFQLLKNFHILNMCSNFWVFSTLVWLWFLWNGCIREKLNVQCISYGPYEEYRNYKIRVLKVYILASPNAYLNILEQLQ